MLLIYQATTKEFISHIRENKLSDIMSNNFFGRFWRQPWASEKASRENSLSRVRDVIELGSLYDNMIALEYEVPYNQNRIDCLLFGKDSFDNENVVLIELKQRSQVEVVEDEDEWNFVETYTWWGKRKVSHPSQQVKWYCGYIKNFVSDFETQPELWLFGCVYCHNYPKKEWEGLFNPIYQKIIDEFPIYTREDTKLLADKIKDLLSAWNWFEIFNRFMQSPIRPSQKLLENVSKIIKNEVVFSLLNEQLVAKNLIRSKVKRYEKNKEKSVIIVHWWPGTWKSVIAINILAEAAQKKKKVFYGCKSKPFIEGLKKLVWKDWWMLFSNLYRFLPSKMQEDELDLLLIDEAHRIEKNSNHQYTKAEDRTDISQIDQLIRCAKTSVFFIDDRQNVRSQEIWNSEMVLEAAKKFNCTVSEVTLETQYRCMWSNDYLQRLEYILWYTKEPKIFRKNDIFDFQIFNSPQKLYDTLLQKEADKNNSARMVAGFCRTRSKTLDENWELVKDVKIWDFAMPWETHGDITPPKWFVKRYERAYKPEWVKQVGCIYTAQWFEFDYIGVIIWNDLIYDKETDSLKANITATKDPTLRKSKENFEHHVKNIYRTLLSRGMKWCYVYFVDKEVEEYFRSKLD